MKDVVENTRYSRDAKGVAAVIAAEAFAWTEAILGAVPGRVGRYIRVFAYWPILPRARNVGRRVTIKRPRSLIAGRRIEISDGCHITCSGEVEIGDDTILGPGVMVFSNNHGTSRLDVPIHAQPNPGAKVTIGSDVWVGACSIILAGITIGDGAVVAAGSIVTSDVQPMSIVAGNPAKEVRKRGPEVD